jgi:hypothetical protein
MPYIGVNIAFGIFSQVYFAVAVSWVLSRFPAASFYLPQRLKSGRSARFAAHCLSVLGLSEALVRFLTGYYHTFAYSLPIFDVFFDIGLVITGVSLYGSLDKRLLLKRPKLLRWSVNALLALLVTALLALAIVIAITGLFIIK